MRAAPPVSAANAEQTISRGWFWEGGDFLVYLLVSGFGLTHAMPMSMVTGEGWCPGRGLTTVHPCQRPCWSLGIWAKLYRAVVTLVPSPWGWHCHKCLLLFIVFGSSSAFPW